MNIKKLLVFLMIPSLLLFYMPETHAHASSQSGILATSYIQQYGASYIGGEDVGWSIDEDYHTNGTTIKYKFISGTDNSIKEIVRDGADLWHDLISISENASGVGTVGTGSLPNGVIAAFCDYTANSSGHLTSWKILINPNYLSILTDVAIAHEFGHVIGLNDLYRISNKNKLMYGYDNGTASSPSYYDNWGAQVIIGAHVSHTWSYRYKKTNAAGDIHVKFCVFCNGEKYNSAELCSYGSGTVCTKCGHQMSISPNSSLPMLPPMQIDFYINTDEPRKVFSLFKYIRPLS